MLNTKTKKVTGFYGAGIPLDFGEVVSVYTDKTVDILWNDGSEVNVRFDEIKVGNHENGIGYPCNRIGLLLIALTRRCRKHCH